MTRIRRSLGVAAAGLALAAVLAPPATAAKSPRCKAPTALSLVRAKGATTARLTWRVPHGVPAGARFRVYRDGRVVSQTQATRQRVRVSLGRTYRFKVRVFTAKGRRTRCAVVRRIKVAYQAPGTVTNLGASDASGASVTLSWQPAVRGDAPIGAYRVLRGDAVFRQTHDTSMSVPVASQRAYDFRVVAVDRRGTLGPASAPVTVVTGHTAPPVPADLAAPDVTDSSVTLQWSPSVPARGRVTGYRILRDGQPVRQVAGTTVRLENLYAQRQYTFTVAAVDSLGYVSAPSAPLTVTTNVPAPSVGRAYAFLLASTGQSFKDFQAHYRQIGTVTPTFYDCNLATGALEGRHDELITRYAQVRKVLVLPRFNCQKTEILHRILTVPELRRAWLDQMVASVVEHGYDGLNLDFEAGLAADRQAYSDFVADLAGRLHALGKKLSVAVSAKLKDVPNHPRSTFFDYLALSEHADTIFVMAWGIHWATSPKAGAPDDLPWVTSVADYIATIPNKSRFVIGMPLYGMDWAQVRSSPTEVADQLEYDDVAALVQRTGSTPRLDPVSDGWTFTYTAADGRLRDVWYADAQTVATRMRLATDRGLGVGFWRLGREDQRVWADPLLN